MRARRTACRWGEEEEARPTRVAVVDPSAIQINSGATVKDVAEYLDVRYLPDDFGDYAPEDLLRGLGYVFSQQNIIDLASLSDDLG